jgi:hypothetical protein
MNRFARLLLMSAALAPAPLLAQPAEPEPPIRHVVIYGNDKCPTSVSGEVVICARRPETERNRIPEALREETPGPESQSWAARARSLEDDAKTGTDSCSAVGPGGQTGCLQEQIDRSRVGKDGKDEPQPS